MYFLYFLHPLLLKNFVLAAAPDILILSFSSFFYNSIKQYFFFKSIILHRKPSIYRRRLFSYGFINFYDSVLYVFVCFSIITYLFFLILHFLSLFFLHFSCPRCSSRQTRAILLYNIYFTIYFLILHTSLR